MPSWRWSTVVARLLRAPTDGTITMDLKAQRAAALKAAQTIIENAKTSDRELTDTEVAQVEGKFGEIESLDKLISKAEKSAKIINGLNSLGGNLPDASWDVGAATKGGVFNDSQAEALTRAWSTKSAFRTHVNLPRTKAALLSGSLIPPTGTDVALAPAPTATVSLRDLFTQESAPGPTVRYYVISGGTAGVVAEGETKPDAGVVQTSVDAPLVKLASVFKYSDELSIDAPFLVKEISAAVVRAVLAAENQQVVQAWAGANGILTYAGSQSAPIDAVAAAIGQSESFNGVSPVTLAANPTDVAGMRTAKATTAGSYYIDPTQPGPSSLFGLQVMSTPAVPAGTMYLLTPQLGIFYTDTHGGQGGVRVESGFSGTDFEQNLVSVRVEERVLPAVTQPSYVTKIDLAA